MAAGRSQTQQDSVEQVIRALAQQLDFSHEQLAECFADHNFDHLMVRTALEVASPSLPPNPRIPLRCRPLLCGRTQPDLWRFCFWVCFHLWGAGTNAYACMRNLAKLPQPHPSHYLPCGCRHRRGASACRRKPRESSRV
jgi:hypothetical protein